jgi:hypothetical protein
MDHGTSPEIRVYYLSYSCQSGDFIEDVLSLKTQYTPFRHLTNVDKNSVGGNRRRGTNCPSKVIPSRVLETFFDSATAGGRSTAPALNRLRLLGLLVGSSTIYTASVHAHPSLSMLCNHNNNVTRKILLFVSQS